MKKIIQTVVVAIMFLTPVALAGSASAASTCAVGYTGPNSDNLCVSQTIYECNVVNSTTVSVDGLNIQVGASGDATGGSATSGSAVNTNGVTFTATVHNEGCNAQATIPAVVVTPPTTPTPTPTQPVVVAPQPVTAAALPDTASVSPLAAIGIAIGALGIGALLVRVAASTYLRMKS